MNILLLEDDIALNKAITKVLELDGHSVDSFDDGADVLEKLTDSYDLYVLDINVPNVNGIELLELIHNYDKNSKIIMITSLNDVQTLKNAYDLGCTDYLNKPFYLEELQIKVNKLDTVSSDILSKINLHPNTSLTKKDTNLLRLLFEYEGKTVPYSIIDYTVYKDKTMSMNALRILVYRLNAKLMNFTITNIIDEGYSLK